MEAALQRRRRASASEAASAEPTSPRKRQIRDLIQIVTLYQKEGILCELDPSHKDYIERAATELSVLTSIPISGAKMVMKLAGIGHNDEAWKVLKQCSMLRVFDDNNFYGDHNQDGGSICLSFLEKFINGSDSKLLDERLQRNSKLDIIALSYSATARDLCVAMFLSCVAVISTLCSFFPQKKPLDKMQVADILERYLSDSWTSDSRQKRYHDSASRLYAVDGWFIVTEVFKIQVQELRFQKKGMTKGSTAAEHDIVVTEEDVRASAHLWCHRVVVEFLAWTYRLLDTQTTIKDYLDTVYDVVDKLHEKLAEEMGCGKKEYIPDDLIKSTLDVILRNAPTMAEVIYDTEKMVPNKRVARSKRVVKWIPKEVLMRARWKDSPVHIVYEAFIKAAKFVEEQQCTRDDVARVNRVTEAPVEVVEHTRPPTFEHLESALSRLPRTSVFSNPPHRNWITPGEGPPMKRGREDTNDAPRSKRFHRDICAPVPIYEPAPGNLTRVGIATPPPILHRPIYLHDGEDSDDERTERGPTPDEDQNGPQKKLSKEAEATNDSIHRFYEMTLSWSIFELERQYPYHPNGTVRPLNIEEKLNTHLLTGMRTWVEGYMERHGDQILQDVTTAKRIDEYSKNWKAIIPFEVRAMISDAVGTLLPKCKARPGASFSEDISENEFVQCLVDKVAPTKGLINITAKSLSPSLNKRIAQEFQGGTICVGYIHTKGKTRARSDYSGLILVGCRRVSWDEDDVAPLGQTDTIDQIELHLVVSRHRIREVGVWEGDNVFLRHLCHFAPSLRMYKALEECHRLPQFLRDTLHGNNQPTKITDSDVMEELIDRGCSDYLQGLRESSAKLDDSQFKALRSVLANIGKCGPYSSSVSLVQGPPGTGKTTTVLYLIGALLHHAKVGHIGREQVDALKDVTPRDDIQRCRKEPGGVRILICAPSNKGVDTILERIHRDGIPDGKGGKIWPQTVRLARARYDHGELYMYSVDEKALPFDEHIHNSGQPNRKTASSAARKSFFQECIVVLATLVSSGGARFKKCKIPFNVVVVDEAGQSSEPEVLIPATNMVKRSGQCHMVAVGDPYQLPPVALASYQMKRLKTLLHFDYEKQMVSVFERLQAQNRASTHMLTRQYRMCGAVADMNNQIFYAGKLESTLPESIFDAPYNKGWDPVTGSFARQTFIDTSLLPSRGEVLSEKEGEYRNIEEINIIDEVLHRIKLLAGDSFEALRNQIAVLVPYRSQVDEMRLKLESFGKYTRTGVSRQGFRILVDSVDSMQGSEKDIVIFGSTRSNNQQ